MKKERKSTRLLLAWVRRWLRSSKPTEWISSLTACVGVLGTLTAGIILVANGFLDVKKSELEAKRSEISIQNVKLGLEQKDLLAHRDAISAQIAKSEAALKDKEAELVDTQNRLGTTVAQLTHAQDELAAYIENEKALTLLTSYNQLNTIDRKAKVGALKCAVTINPSLNIARVTIEGGGDDAEPVISDDKNKLLAAAQAVLKLNHLSIKNVRLGACDLTAISRMPHLRHLDLTNCGLTDQDIRSLSLDKNVNYIKLDRNSITKLPTIKHRWAIQVLDVSDTGIGDEEMSGLVDGAVNLYALNMASTAVTDRTLGMIRRGQVEIDNIRVDGTKVSVEGVKGLIVRTQPNWVIMGLHEDQKPNLETFLKENNLKCCIVMTDGGFMDRRNKGKTVIIGESKNTRQMRDGGVIYAKVGEMVVVEADIETFKFKKEDAGQKKD